jgi:hypothetical protein
MAARANPFLNISSSFQNFKNKIGIKAPYTMFLKKCPPRNESVTSAGFHPWIENPRRFC